MDDIKRLQYNKNFLKWNGLLLSVKVKDKIKVTKTGYGALYNWWVTQNELIEGFIVPHDNDVIILRDYLGGTNLAGDKLKSTRVSPAYTIAPFWTFSTSHTNITNFSALPAGNRLPSGFYNNIGISTIYHLNNGGKRWGLAGTSIPLSINNNDNSKTGISIRCVRSTALTIEESLLPDGSILGHIQDYDGNYYEVVKIGTQAWSAQNLRTTHYANGTPIPNVTDDTSWGGLTTGAMCWYNNDINTPGIVYTDEFIKI